MYRDILAALAEQLDDGGDNIAVTGSEEGTEIVEGDLSTTPTTVPEHLRDLFERSTKHLDNTAQKDAVKSLLSQYADVFASSLEDLGRTGLEKHKINTGDAPPIKQPARRIPMHMRSTVDEEVKKMLKKGVIESSSSPWSSPVVLVRKKDGSIRFCVDYRKLDNLTIKDSYPLPRIDDSLDALSESQWFLTLDLASGYWQVERAEEDKHKTAFIMDDGLYQFWVFPFGLCNAPATFERLMGKVLVGLPWKICLVYLDDVIVYATTFSDELERLRVAFERLRVAKLKLSPKKCHSFLTEVLFLGHVVGQNGVGTDPAKVDAVKK